MADALAIEIDVCGLSTETPSKLLLIADISFARTQSMPRNLMMISLEMKPRNPSPSPTNIQIAPYFPAFDSQAEMADDEHHVRDQAGETHLERDILELGDSQAEDQRFRCHSIFLSRASFWRSRQFACETR